MSSTTQQKYIYVGANQMQLDSATRSTVGASPDIIDVILMADSASQYATFTIQVPNDWNGSSSITATVIYTAQNTSGDFRLRCEMDVLTTGDTPGEAGTAFDLTLTPPDSGVRMHGSSFGGLTPTLSTDIIKFSIGRLGGNAADTNTGNFRLVGVLLQYTATVVSGPQGPAGAAGAAGSNTIIVQKGDVDVDTAAATLDFDTTDFDVSSSPAGEANVSIPVTAQGAYRKSIEGGKRAFLYEEFMDVLAVGSEKWQYLHSNLSGTNAAISTPGVSESGHFGVATMSTGTTTTGRASFQSDLGLIAFGDGKCRIGWWVKTPSSLSDGTNKYTIRAGMMDSNADADNEGVYLKYTHDDNSGKWLGVSKKNSVAKQTLDTAVTVVASTWYFLEIEVNAAGTSVEYFVNGASKGTITSSIPLISNGDALGVICYIMKAAGTSARVMSVDANYVDKTFTTAR
jgi:hypothetical protein